MRETSSPGLIRLRGVRQNNLKQLNLDLPLGKLIVITGPSGSGKSSLAFETLYAEGQRRYIETFSPYARQFFDRMDKPQVDHIEGIPPAIAIEQRNLVRTTRSTVGTMTEICDYMKLLWPHLAQLHCRQCGKAVRREWPAEIWTTLSGLEQRGKPLARAAEGPGQSSPRVEGHGAESGNQPDGAEGHGTKEVLVAFDLPLSEKLALGESLTLVARQGYQRLLIGDEIARLEDAGERLAELKPGALTIIQDRLRLTRANRARFLEACEHAYHFGKGRLKIHELDGASGGRESCVQPARFFSNRLHCATCDLEYREASAALFSFNHPLGACPTCHGFGRTITIDYHLALPDLTKTLAGGVVRPWQRGFSAECQEDLLRYCRLRKVPTDVPFGQLPKAMQDWVVEGDPGYGKDKEHEWPRAWYGVKGYFRWLESKAYKMHVRVLLSRYRAYRTCPDCQGRRFQPEALLYRVDTESDSRRDVRQADAGAGVRLGRSSEAPATGELDANTLPKEEPVGGSFPVKIGQTLADFYQRPIREALEWMESLARRRPPKADDPLAVALEEVRARLRYLDEVGLGYLTLDRSTRSLSGGETARVNLTTCLGTRLVNTLFVLDEPTVGLHARDTERLVRVLAHLRTAGNTVVVVEHEASVIRAADQIVDLGPGSGEGGGQLVFQGPYRQVLQSRASLTGEYLSGRKRIEIPLRWPIIRPVGLAGESWLTLEHATEHNLNDVTIQIPLSRLVCVTGVSGSGKTTLVREVLLPALTEKLADREKESNSPNATAEVGPQDAEKNDESEAEHPLADRRLASVSGWEALGRVILVDQSLLGKTPRSNPAVYIGAFEPLRELFAQTETARQRGLNASAFSFNSAQGQCERCRGAGFEKIEMQFLSDVFIRCPDCHGRRYRPHILEVKLSAARDATPVPDPGSTRSGARAAGNGRPAARSTKGSPGSGNTPEPHRTQSRSKWSIADVLEATVDEAVHLLEGFSESRPAQRAVQSLRLLQEVGLGYLRLGQPINTLSGGESQRLKLVRHLADFAQNSEEDAKPTLFLFDEPTTGLHFDDVRVLLAVFQRLVDSGHSVVVIEHNLEVIKSADWLIDLGPEAGDQGGRVVADGTPEQVAACPESHTGRALSTLSHSARRKRKSSNVKL
jgi:excinuclease ABC subunit A